MHKLSFALPLVVLLSACANIDIDKDSWDLFGDVIPRSLEKLPFVYRPPIVQGNLITQDHVNQLKPGMSKKQVELIMGTALLQDVFHDNRWDYYYGMGIGKIELEKRLTLYFENDRLVRIVGDYQPLPQLQGEGKPQNPEALITVPDWVPEHKTLVETLLETISPEYQPRALEESAKQQAREHAEEKQQHALPKTKPEGQ